MEEYATKQELSEFKKEVRAELKCFQSDHTDIKVWQGTYGTKIENIDQKVNELSDSLKEKVNELNESLKEILSRPQRRWDSVVAAAISAIIGGGIGAIIANLFNGVS